MKGQDIFTFGPFEDWEGLDGEGRLTNNPQAAGTVLAEAKGQEHGMASREPW